MTSDSDHNKENAEDTETACSESGSSVGDDESFVQDVSLIDFLTLSKVAGDSESYKSQLSSML
jgi:hypothetical protein